jgi:hypothetical protein
MPQPRCFLLTILSAISHPIVQLQSMARVHWLQQLKQAARAGAAARCAARRFRFSLNRIALCLRSL